MKCPNGLEWNQKVKECDLPYIANCHIKTTTTTRRPPTPIPNYKCPAGDIARGCKGPKDCLYTNPASCNSFIQCTAAGLAYVMPCPSGLQWNDDEKICDWPSQSTCGRTPSPSTTTTTTTSSITTISSTTTSSTTGSQSSTTTQSSTTPVCGNDNDPEDADLNLDTLCSGCSERHLVENPNSQQRYIECNGGPDNNENSVKKCSPGLLFDPNRLTCDYSGLVNSKAYLIY